MIELRRENPVFHRRRFFNGRSVHETSLGDILWLNPTGHEMTDENWSDGNQRSIGMILNGEGMDEYDERGRRIKDDIFLLILNGYWEGVEFTLPGVKEFTRWELQVDTNTSELPVDTVYLADDTFTLGPRSLYLFRLKLRQANQTPEGKRKVTIVEQVRRLLQMIQE